MPGDGATFKIFLVQCREHTIDTGHKNMGSVPSRDRTLPTWGSILYFLPSPPVGAVGVSFAIRSRKSVAVSKDTAAAAVLAGCDRTNPGNVMERVDLPFPPLAHCSEKTPDAISSGNKPETAPPTPFSR